MNRHQRRRAKSLGYRIAASFSQISPDAFQVGAITHAVMNHDLWCKTMKTGSGHDCNCEPEISYHRQPAEGSSR